MARRRGMALAVAVLAGVFGLPGCKLHLGHLRLGPGIEGSGTIASETRPITAFTALEAHGALEVSYQPADSPTLTLTGDDNLLPLVESGVVDGRLVLAMKDGTNIAPTQPLRVAVSGPCPVRFVAHGATRIEARLAPLDTLTVEANGAATIAATGVEASRVSIDADGASTVRLAGRAESVELEANGAATVDAGELAAGRARVDVAGASNATVRASESIEGEASGASHVALAGQPARQSVRTSGASSVK